MTKKRKYDADFKAGAIKLVEQSEKSVVQVAYDLGVRANLLYNWLKKARQPEEVKAAMSHLSKQEEEIRQLKRELKTVKEERDILKKAVGYFAKDNK